MTDDPPKKKKVKPPPPKYEDIDRASGHPKDASLSDQMGGYTDDDLEEAEQILMEQRLAADHTDEDLEEAAQVLMEEDIAAADLAERGYTDEMLLAYESGGGIDLSSYEVTDEFREESQRELKEMMAEKDRIKEEMLKGVPKPEPEKVKKGGAAPKKEKEGISPTVVGVSPYKEKEEPIHKIPGGIIGQFFTCRKKGWRDKLWIVTPGGAQSDDDLQDMPYKMIKSITGITGSRGFVVLSGSDYSIVEKTKATERELYEKRRGREEEVKVDKKVSTVSHALDRRQFLYRPWGEIVWTIDSKKGVARDDDDNEKEMLPKMTEAIARNEKGFTVMDEAYNVVEATLGENNAWKHHRDHEETVEKEKKEEALGEIGISLDDVLDDIDITAEITTSRNASNFIGYIKEYCGDRMEDWPPYGFEILGLTFLSSLLDSRVIFVDKWKKRYYPGLFTLVVGPPATRKSSGIQVINDIMRDLEEKINRPLILSGDWTREAGERYINEEGCEALILHDDEFADYLDPSIGASYKKGYKEWILRIFDIYDRPVLRVDDRGKTSSVKFFQSKHLAVSFESTIQTNRFHRLVGRDDVESGFYGRFCYIILPPSKGKAVQGQATQVQLDNELRIKAIGLDIAKAVNGIDKDSPTIFAFKPEDDPYVTEWYDTIYDKCRLYGKNTSWTLYALAERSFTLMKKTAMMFEILSLIGEGETRLKRPEDGSGLPIYRIRKENIDEGKKLAEINFDIMINQFFKIGGSSGGKIIDYEKIFKELFQRPSLRPLRVKNLGTVVQRSDLLNHLHIKSRELNEVLITFKESNKYFEYPIKNKKTNRTTKYVINFQIPIGDEKNDKLAKTIFKHFETKKKPKK